MSVTLLERNGRFRRRHWHAHGRRMRALAAGQRPLALYLGCSDSRVVPDTFLDAKPGELFVVRQIAAIVPPAEHASSRPLAAALEYALEVLDVQHVIVCGHDLCGGLAALLDNASPADSQLAAWLEDAAIDVTLRNELARLPRTAAVERFVERQLEVLARYPTVARRLAARRLSLHGWVYDMTSGQVRARCAEGDFRVWPDGHADAPAEERP